MKKILIVGIPLVAFNAIVVSAIYETLEVPLWAFAVIACAELFIDFIGILVSSYVLYKKDDNLMDWYLFGKEEELGPGDIAMRHEYYIYDNLYKSLIKYSIADCVQNLAQSVPSDVYNEYLNNSLSTIVANTNPIKKKNSSNTLPYIGGLKGVFMPRTYIATDEFFAYENSEVIAFKSRKKISIINVILSMASTYLIAFGVLMFIFIKGGLAALGLLPIAVGGAAIFVCLQLPRAFEKKYF